MIRPLAVVLVLVLVLGASGALAAGEPPACATCGKRAEADWRFCPFDGAALPTPTATPSRDVLGAAHSNPMDTVEDLFRAIAASDEEWIKRLYRWETFFGEPDPATLETRTADYVKRLVAKVKPTLGGRERIPVDVKLTPDVAEFKVQLRDRQTREAVMTYEFKLAKGADGWKIVSIRP